MAAVITKAQQQDIGSIPKGVDSHIDVVMSPVVNTSSWSVECSFAATRGGAPVLTLTSAAGQIVTGLGTNDETIRITIANADESVLDGRLWYDVRRVDAGNRDRLAFGTIKFDQPEV